MLLDFMCFPNSSYHGRNVMSLAKYSLSWDELFKSFYCRHVTANITAWNRCNFYCGWRQILQLDREKGLLTRLIWIEAMVSIVSGVWCNHVCSTLPAWALFCLIFQSGGEFIGQVLHWFPYHKEPRSFQFSLLHLKPTDWLLQAKDILVVDWLSFSMWSRSQNAWLEMILC